MQMIPLGSKYDLVIIARIYATIILHVTDIESSTRSHSNFMATSAAPRSYGDLMATLIAASWQPH